MKAGFAAVVVVLAGGLGVLCAAAPGLAVGATITCLLLAAWRTQAVRYQRLAWGTEAAKVALCWQVVAFPTLLGLRASQLSVALIGVALLTASVLLKPARRKLDPRALRWTLLVTLALFVPVVRAEPSWEMAFGVLAAAFIIRLALVAEARSVVVSLTYGIGVYLAANAVLFYGFGMTSPTAAIRMSGFGAGGTERAFFPLSVSVNLPPNMAALYVVAAIPLFAATSSARRRLALAAGLVAAVAVLNGGSSRTSILTVIVVAGLALAMPRLLQRAAPATVVVAGLAGFFYTWLAGAVGRTLAFLASFVPYLDRGSASAETFASLGGRREIWTNVVQAWADAPLVEKVIGYGADGQVASGASLTYSYLFRGWLANPYEGTAHNSALQMLLDAGAVGVILFLGVLIATVRQWSQLHESAGLAATSMLVVLALVSLTEVATVPGQGQDTFWLLALLALAAPLAARSGGGGVSDESERGQRGQRGRQRRVAATAAGDRRLG